jgi:predicted SAM-dependent methyltransferase
VIPLPEKVKAVNLGCGITVAPGWINIDNSPNARLSRYPRLRWLLLKAGVLSDAHYSVSWPKSILIHDLRKKLPFSDCSVNYVYTSHVLEHLTAADARKLIKEVFRILKPGGMARVVVPDLAYGARCYLDALANNPSDPNAAPGFLNWLGLSRSGVRAPHLWMYDASSLSAVLTQAGFINAVVCKCGHGQVPDCAALDVRPDESLYIEVEKR